MLQWSNDCLNMYCIASSELLNRMGRVSENQVVDGIYRGASSLPCRLDCFAELFLWWGKDYMCVCHWGRGYREGGSDWASSTSQLSKQQKHFHFCKTFEFVIREHPLLIYLQLGASTAQSPTLLWSCCHWPFYPVFLLLTSSSTMLSSWQPCDNPVG